jgi:hypothetical protein
MPITSIEEIHNDNIPKMEPIKEVMNLYVDGIPDGVSNRNGMIYILCGAGGSGKTSLLLSMFKTKLLYLKKFDNIYYICPESSFLSVQKHVFEKHDKVYHELSASLLYEIYDELKIIKEERSKNKKRQHYNLIIIDDFADVMKNKDILTILSKMLIKARHINTGFIFTLQSYFYFPKILRKQITFATIFRPKNVEEFETLAKELCNMNRDDALKLFNYVFDESYTHLDIDTQLGKYYKNFNILKLNEKK